MCRVISVSNQKGGVSKSTTVMNLGVGLAKEGKKVLLIDGDPQGSLTASMGYPEPDRIKRLARYKQDDDEYQKRMENLLFQRANIQKSADEKLEALQILLESLGNEAEKMLIFVSPDQLQKVMKLLHDLHIPAHKFTEEEGTQKCEKYDGLSEREYLVHHFKKGTYKALVAISCLDEGIDIPIADKAILMANSTNPREYIQRIGRVIRQRALGIIALCKEYVFD